MNCEMCDQAMSQEEYDFCDICPDCRDGQPAQAQPAQSLSPQDDDLLF